MPRIILPSLPNTANMNSRLHWAAQWNLKYEARMEMLVAARDAGLENALLAPVEICLHFGLKDRRRRDLDNLITASKTWLDGLGPPTKGKNRDLPGASVIPDDGTAHVLRISGEWFRSDEPCTVIDIILLPADALKNGPPPLPYEDGPSAGRLFG